MPDYLELADGTGVLELADGTGNLLLAEQDPVDATAAVQLGGLVATALIGVAAPASAQVSLGGAVVEASITVFETFTASVPLGGLAAHAAIGVGVGATASCPLGGAVVHAAMGPVTFATASVPLGGLDVSATTFVLPGRALGARDLWVSGCTIGFADTRVLVLDHCGKSTVCDLTDALSFADYTRVLNNDSELEISIHMRGDAGSQACCDCLENIRTWRHELMVERDGEVVWGPGPLVTIDVQREITHLVARDITAWLDVRLVHTDYDFVQVDLSTIAETVITDALTLGDAALLPAATRDACILGLAHFEPAGKLQDLKIDANKRSAGEVLRELAGDGLDFTVVKRSLVVGSNFAWGPLGPLRDDDFLGDLEISEHGLAAATSWRMSGDKTTGTCGGVDPYLGLIERAVEGQATDTQTDLDRIACERLAGSNPPPITVNVPSGSALSPRAPVCPEVLIPGSLVDLAVVHQCRGVQLQQRLTAVQFRADDNGERVEVTLEPVGGPLLDTAA